MSSMGLSMSDCLSLFEVLDRGVRGVVFRFVFAPAILHKAICCLGLAMYALPSAFAR